MAVQEAHVQVVRHRTLTAARKLKAMLVYEAARHALLAARGSDAFPDTPPVSARSAFSEPAGRQRAITMCCRHTHFLVDHSAPYRREISVVSVTSHY